MPGGIIYIDLTNVGTRETSYGNPQYLFGHVR